MHVAAGSAVVLAGLSRTELNGCVGVIMSGPTCDDRFTVHVWRSAAVTASMSVRPQNLCALSETVQLRLGTWLLPAEDDEGRRELLQRIGCPIAQRWANGFELSAADLGAFHTASGRGASTPDPPAVKQLMLEVTLAIMPDAALESLQSTGMAPTDAVDAKDLGRALVELFDENLARILPVASDNVSKCDVQRLLEAWRAAFAHRLGVAIGANTIDGDNSVFVADDACAPVNSFESGSAASETPIRIGLACMTKRPVDLDTWLAHHQSHVGIERFYLRVEDTPEVEEMLQQPPWNRLVEAEFVHGTERDAWAQVDRQVTHVATAVQRARAAGLTHLLHCDDDELIYCQHGAEALHSALRSAPTHHSNIHLRNLEALVPSASCMSPFREVSAFRHRPAEFVGHCCGKSIGRLDEQTLSAKGAHHFGSDAQWSVHLIPPSVAVLLHYESATFDQWRLKFCDLAARHGDDARTLDQISSEYYRESLAAGCNILRTKGAPDSPAAVEAQMHAHAVWCKHKLAPPQLPPPSQEPIVLRPRGLTILNPFACETVGTLVAEIGHFDPWRRFATSLGLHLTRGATPHDNSSSSIGAGRDSVSHQEEDWLAQLRDNGYVHIENWGQFRPYEFGDPPFSNYAAAAAKLHDAGLPATFLTVFDEVWDTACELGRDLERAFGLKMRLDLQVHHGTHGDSGWPMHRDHWNEANCSGEAHLVEHKVFQSNGMPSTVTAWLALNENVPRGSCMYVLPAPADPEYWRPLDPSLANTANNSKDEEEVIQLTMRAHQKVRALPMLCGSALVWSHRLINWRSAHAGGAKPCTGIAFSLTESERDAPLVHNWRAGTTPTFEGRLALAAANALASHHVYPISGRVVPHLLRILLNHAAELNDSAFDGHRLVGQPLQQNLLVIYAEAGTQMTAQAVEDMELVRAIAMYIVQSRGLNACDGLRLIASQTHTTARTDTGTGTGANADARSPNRPLAETFGTATLLHDLNDFEANTKSGGTFVHNTGELVCRPPADGNLAASAFLCSRRASFTSFRVWFEAVAHSGAMGGFQILSEDTMKEPARGILICVGPSNAGRLHVRSSAGIWESTARCGCPWHEKSWNAFDVEVRPLMDASMHHVRVHVNSQLVSDERLTLSWSERRVAFMVHGSSSCGDRLGVLHFRSMRIAEWQLPMAGLPLYAHLSSERDAPPFVTCNDSAVGESTYDYIVVGGGGAGCTAAYTLARDFPTKRVLLVEGGARYSLYGATTGAKETVGQGPQAKTVAHLLGGGTRCNGLAWRNVPDWYVREHMYGEDDTYFWAFANARTWTDQALANPRDRKPRCHTVSRPSGGHSDGLTYTVGGVAFDKVEASAGYGTVSMQDDSGQTISADAMLGSDAEDRPCYYYPLQSHDLCGRRTSGQSLIESFEGDNLTVLTSAYVEQLLFDAADGTHANGIALKNGRVLRLSATGEVLLTANVYETPTLLQRSGIGPARVLAQIGAAQHTAVPVPAAEQVGGNYWSNLYISRLDFRRTFPALPTPEVVRLQQSERVNCMIQERRGDVTHTIRADVEASFLDVEDTSRLIGGQVEESGIAYQPKIHYCWELDECAQDAAAVFVTSLEVYIRHAMPPDDFVFEGDNGPIRPPSDAPWASDPQVVSAMVDILNRGVYDSIHCGGTCALGAVVDRQTFLLKGLGNVRVADLSIFPSNLPCNTAAAACTIGRFVARYVIGRASPELSCKAAFEQRYRQLSAEFAWTRFAHLRMTPLLHPDLSGLDRYELGAMVRVGFYRHEIWPSVWLPADSSMCSRFERFLSGSFMPLLVPSNKCSLLVEVCVPSTIALTVTMQADDGFQLGLVLTSTSIHLLTGSAVLLQSASARSLTVEADTWVTVQLSYIRQSGLVSLSFDGETIVSELVPSWKRLDAFKLQISGEANEPARVRAIYAS